MSATENTTALSATRIGAITTIAVFGGITAPLQPLLLGALAESGRLSIPQIGYAAMLEAGGMAVTAAIAGAWLKPDRLKRLALIGATLALAANTATAMLPGLWVLPARAISGVGAGLLVFLYVALLARIPAPARIAAAYNVGQSLLALSLTSLLSVLLIPRFGPTAGYAVLMLLNLGMMALIAGVPDHLPASGKSAHRALPSPRGFAAMLVVTLQMGAILGAWVYAMPFARRAGLDPAQGGLILSLALGLQIAAGLTAAALAPRLNSLAMLIGGMFSGIIALACIIAFPDPIGFAAGLLLFGAAWSCSTPFQMAFLITADPGRGAAMQIVTAQLAGVSLGPLLAAFGAVGFGVAGAAYAGCALFAGGLLLAIAVGTINARTCRGVAHG